MIGLVRVGASVGRDVHRMRTGLTSTGSMARGRVYKRSGGWADRVDIGVDPETGKRRQALRQGFGTKREAEKALDAVVHSAETGSVVSRSTMRLSEFLDNWVAGQSQHLRETTQHSYEMAVKRMKPKLGVVTLQALTTLQVERFYAELDGVTGTTKRVLSPKTIRNTHVVLRKALADAERLGFVNRNVAAAARPPTAQRPEFATWSSAELRQFFEAARAEPARAAYVLCATTGMRRGEILGLRWSDIDFDAGQLAVVQTVTTVNNRLIVSLPKTQRSRRTMFLDPHTLSVLAEHRKRQSEARLAAGPDWDVHANLVFTDAVGKPIHPDLLSRTFTRISREAKLPTIRFHDLRHTYATLALKTGIHPKVVSERLGHATVAITLDLYSHVTPAIARDAADAVAATIFGT